MPYTLYGRYYVQGLDTSPIVSGRPDLFQNILNTLSIDSLTELTSLYNISDTVRGINPNNQRIIVIVDNRTTAWLMGSPGYEYASTFSSYPGLTYLQTSSFSKSVYNESSNYLAFELTLPQLTTRSGPVVSVQYSNSSLRNIATTMTYYALNNANYTLTLSGSDQYIVEGIPINWLFESIDSPEVLTFNITQLNDGSFLKIENAVPNNTVVIRWASNAQLDDVAWKFVQWQNGWQAGPYSSSKTGLLQFAPVEGMLRLSLNAGLAGGYSSVLITNLSLPLNNVTDLFLSVNGTQNTELALAVNLANGSRVFLFNSTSPTFFSISPNFQNIEQPWTLGNNTSISGIQIFIMSTDGSPCESFIKCFWAVQ